MEKTVYEIKYNDWFTLQMESEREPMEQIGFEVVSHLKGGTT
jgi:hypothetical protein